MKNTTVKFKNAGEVKIEKLETSDLRALVKDEQAAEVICQLLFDQVAYHEVQAVCGNKQKTKDGEKIPGEFVKNTGEKGKTKVYLDEDGVWKRSWTVAKRERGISKAIELAARAKLKLAEQLGSDLTWDQAVEMAQQDAEEAKAEE